MDEKGCTFNGRGQGRAVLAQKSRFHDQAFLKFLVNLPHYNPNSQNYHKVL